MFALLKFFFELMLLRRNPQQLPASLPLLLVLSLANMALTVPLAMATFGNLQTALLASLLELVASAALLFAGLQVRGHSARWLQSFTALMGLGLLIGLMTSGYRVLASMLGVPGLAGMLDLLMFAWSLLAMAHVLRHAFEIALPFALLIVFAYTMFLLGVMAQMVPGMSAAGAT